MATELELPRTREELTAWALINSGNHESLYSKYHTELFNEGLLSLLNSGRAREYNQRAVKIRADISNWIVQLLEEMPDVVTIQSDVTILISVFVSGIHCLTLKTLDTPLVRALFKAGKIDAETLRLSKLFL